MPLIRNGKEWSHKSLQPSETARQRPTPASLTGFGLGHLLHYGRELNAMDQVIGVMIVIVLIGLLTDKVLFAPWERFLHRRWGTGVRLS